MKDLQLMILKYSETARDPDSGLKLKYARSIGSVFFGHCWNVLVLLESFSLLLVGINSSQILGSPGNDAGNGSVKIRKSSAAAVPSMKISWTWSY